MGSRLAPPRKKSNSAGDKTVPALGQKCPRQRAVMKRFRALYPQKTVLHLLLRTTADQTRPPSERTVKRWLGCQNEMPAEAFIELLNSDFGPELLKISTAASNAGWVKNLAHHLEIVDVVRQQKSLARKLADLQRLSVEGDDA
jgi:hypothetical protein